MVAARSIAFFQQKTEMGFELWAKHNLPIDHLRYSRPIYQALKDAGHGIAARHLIARTTRRPISPGRGSGLDLLAMLPLKQAPKNVRKK